MNGIDYKLVVELSNDIDILNQIIKTTSALSKLNGISKIIPNQKILINTLGIQESTSSSEIENIFTTSSEVYIGMLEQPQNINTKEVLNYSKAANYAKEYISQRPITSNMITKVQQLIEPDKSGFRKFQVHIGNCKTGEIIHIPPTVSKIPKLIDELLEFINYDQKQFDINPLVAIIVTHHRFECIHPFLDGNGRTGRILIITQLIDRGYLEEPILYLSRYINNTRVEYYKHLNNLSKCASYEHWKKFILYYLQAMEVVACESIKTVNEVNALIEEIRSKLISLRFSRRMDIRLIELLFEHPYITINEYKRRLQVTTEIAEEDIKELVDNNIIAKHTLQNKNYYVNSKLVILLDKVNYLSCKISATAHAVNR